MTPWSAEEMLDGQHQRMDNPARARSTHKGLLQKRPEEDLCCSVPPVFPDDPIGQGTELTVTELRIDLYLFILLSLTLTLFQGHGNTEVLNENYMSISCLSNSHGSFVHTFVCVLALQNISLPRQFISIKIYCKQVIALKCSLNFYMLSSSYYKLPLNTWFCD